MHTRRRVRSALLLLLLVGLPLRGAQAGETVEPWEDGTPKRRFITDDAGLKQGAYFEYHRNGKPAIQATYRNDHLDGTYTELTEAGKVAVRSSYRAGKRNGRHETFGPGGEAMEVSTWADGSLHGKRQVWRDKHVIVTQTWKSGTLETYDGWAPFPRPREEVTRTVAAILAGELPAAERPAKGKPERKPKAPAAKTAYPASIPGLATAPEALAKDREGALRRLRAYRYVCDVPWADLVAGETETVFAQGAAIVCAKLGDITHTPSNPGLPDDVYAIGAKGAGLSNLAWGPKQPVTLAVDGWMDDSDPSNIGAVGHRRWALSLEMRSVGFGAETADEKDYTAMYVQDSSRPAPREMPFVVFPARGWMPSDMFSSHHAFSISVDPVAELKIDTAALSARVVRLSDDFIPAAEGLPIEMKVFETTMLAGRRAFIFRPTGLVVADGAAYLTEISAPDPKSRKSVVILRWITAFTGAPIPEHDTGGERPTDGDDE